MAKAKYVVKMLSRMHYYYTDLSGTDGVLTILKVFAITSAIWINKVDKSSEKRNPHR